jgi:lipopolysaccharide heptosyltransferase I
VYSRDGFYEWLAMAGCRFGRYSSAVPDILFIKTSSLGDVIHHLPALTEAQERHPDARFAWLVEEAFAPLVRLHPAVRELVPVASRRWRKSLWWPVSVREIGASLSALRARKYDIIVDTQGLLRSAMIARAAHGPRHGYDSRSIREPLASLFYDVRHTVSRDLHAIERNRRLTGLALGYISEGAPDYGLDRARLRDTAERTVVLLHATARPEKEWPEANWISLARSLAQRGLRPLLPWGSEHERARAERILAQVPDAQVPDRAPLDQVARLIASADLVVGVDTGLLHLAAALGVPLVAIFGGSKPQLTAPVGSGPMRVLGTYGKAPELACVEETVREMLG